MNKGLGYEIFFPCIAVALLFVACDDHISVAPRDGDSLLPVSEGCDNSSSSDIAPVSNSSETALLGSSAGPAESPVDEPAESSESAKSSSSAKSSESAKISSSSSEKEAVSSSIGTEDIILPNDYNSEMLVKAVPCRTGSVDTCEYGTLTDERDGQTYKTVKIGNLWWMAENLNYAYMAEMDSFYYTMDASSGFDSSDSCLNCSNRGRLYRWSAAMDSAVENPNNLKSSVGWNDSTLNIRSDNGTDDYGFSAIPISCGDFPIEGREACFCSSSTLPNTSSLALYMSLRYDKFSLVSSMGRRNMCSVRCIKD